MRNILPVVPLLAAALSPIPALAASDQEVAVMRQQLAELKTAYEARLAELETKITALETQPAAQASTPVAAAASGRSVYGNGFNPSIGVILNGRFSAFSEGASEIPGFAVGEEGERDPEGLSVGESELNFSSNIDDKFYGSLTAAIVNEAGSQAIELEEAFVQTLPGMGLPTGLTVKGGRALWNFGYLNEHHRHTDDFADRPLPYRVFLNDHFNDDGVQLSYILPTEFYSEIGGGVYRGDDYPFGGAGGDAVNAWSGYARIGGDIGADQSWRLGASVLSGDADGRLSNEDTVDFAGDTELYALDARYIWAPTGNPDNQEVILQGEYFLRSENGTLDDLAAATGPVAFDETSAGWYAQAVYKFLPQWRIGTRYTALDAPGIPAGLAGSALDGGGHDPYAYSAMLDWTNSEFSRLRSQYNFEELAAGQEDHQLVLQYIMSIGAHGAHAF